MRASPVVNCQLTTLFSAVNKTVNGVPENVYIGDSKRNALSLQYAKAYLRYIKPGTVLGRVVQLQLIA